MPISPEVIIKQNTASGNHKYLTGIDHFRSNVKIAVSFFAFRRLQRQCFMTSGGLHFGI